MHACDLQDSWCSQRANTIFGRKHVLQKVINVPNTNAQQVVHWILPNHPPKTQNDPRKVGSREGEEIEEAHVHVAIAFAPHIHHNEGERWGQEHDVARETVVGAQEGNTK